MTDDDDPDLFDYGLYDGSPPAQKHSDTSRAAAESIRKRIGPLHQEILNFLKQRPRGATDEEMQTEIPMPANTQRPRRIELTQMERLADSGRRKLTGSKRHAVIWVLIEHKPAEPLPTNLPVAHTCTICGAAFAPFGHNGVYYCSAHRPRN